MSLTISGCAIGKRKWQVSDLFANAEEGVWYDPSDLSTLYQDAAGTTPVTDVEQPVGLMLDKSKGLVFGPELVANGTFDDNINNWVRSTSGATLSWDAGRLKIETTISTRGAWQQVSFEIGKTYKLTATLVSLTGGAFQIGFTSSPSVFSFASSLNMASGPANMSVYWTATVDSAYVLLRVGTSGNTAIVDNVSCRKVLGNHAFQSTNTTYRPTLSARYNLLTKTEDFENVYWTKSYINSFPNDIYAPNGTLTGYKIIPTIDNQVHRIYVTSGINLTNSSISIYAKASGLYNLRINSGSSSNGYATFNLNTGTIKSSAGTYLASASIYNAGDGWYRCSVSFSMTPGLQLNYVIENSDTAIQFPGDGTSGIYIWGADLRVANDGVNLPPYQRVNTDTDYDTIGFPKYLKFDGSNDCMVTNSIDFTATDKMTVWAGVRKLSDAVRRCVVELGNLAIPTPGGFFINAPLNDTTPQYTFTSVGTAANGSDANYSNSSLSSPVTNVLVGEGRILTDVSILHVNGIQVASVAYDQGTGNFGNYPLYIGARNQTSLYFNGRLYGLIVRGTQTSLMDIRYTEQYLNKKTRAY